MPTRLCAFTLTNKHFTRLFLSFVVASIVRYGLRLKIPRKATGPDSIPLNVIKFASNVMILTSAIFTSMFFYTNSQPKIVTYRSYKYFNNDSFREALLQIECNGNSCDENFKDFTSSCNIILNEQAPRKKKYVRSNQSPLMNKTLSKAIM